MLENDKGHITESHIVARIKNCFALYKKKTNKNEITLRSYSPAICSKPTI